MPEDLELLAAWRDGDAEAGNALVQRHFAPMRRFFRNKLPAPDVEDALQRTFLACVEHRERVAEASNFRAYLFTVARHELYRQIRQRAKSEAADFGVSSLCALGISPSSAVARDEAERRLLEALQRVPLEQQVLLELYYWEDVPGPELAKILQVAEATVRTRLFRARARLREELEKLSGREIPVEDVENTARKLAGNDLPGDDSPPV